MMAEKHAWQSGGAHRLSCYCTILHFFDSTFRIELEKIQYFEARIRLAGRPMEVTNWIQLV